MDHVAPGIRRIRAPNPSPMTERGTNTWLVGAASGRGPVAVIDPGPDDPAHLAAILAGAGPGGVSHILLTHPHRDHSALIPALKAATGAPVLAFGSAEEGRRPAMRALAEAGLAEGGEGLDRSVAPDRRLADGETVAGEGWRLTALHTPGHSAPHLCFLGGALLFSGDLAMGWASTLISPPDGDLGAYLRSLDRLLALGPLQLLPGHGDPVADGSARLAYLARHRADRSAAICAALAAGLGTIAEIAARIYSDTPPALLPAAERNVFAHLIDLVEKGNARAEPRLTVSARFAPARISPRVPLD
jgi:glyoxylase-like metal-dependent hydrolase (beta-lactamase superfamily II)